MEHGAIAQKYGLWRKGPSSWSGRWAREDVMARALANWMAQARAGAPVS
jgi:hypothetical protein